MIKNSNNMDEHEAELRKRFTCPACGTYTHFFIEGKCVDCNNRVPLSVPRTESIQALYEKPIGGTMLFRSG